MTELFERMFNMSISASWVVLAVLLLRILSKRAPRYISCIYWSLVGIRLTVPVSVKSILSIVPTTSAPAVAERASSAVEAVPAEIQQTVNPIIAPEASMGGDRGRFLVLNIIVLKNTRGRFSCGNLGIEFSCTLYGVQVFLSKVTQTCICWE